MSRLLEALRQAEGDRHVSAPPAHGATYSGLALEPLTGDSQPSVEPAGDRPASPPGPTAEPAPPIRRPSSSLVRPLLVGLAGAAALAGMAGGIWLELQPLAHADAPHPGRQVPPEVLPAAPAPPAATPPASIGPLLTTVESPGLPLPVLTRPAVGPRPVRHSDAPEPPTTHRDGLEPQFRRSDSGGETPPTSTAHAALLAGDTVRAEALYRAAHHIAPTDIDALRGLGALALQALRPLDAEAYFTASLDLDPTDPVAIAGLSLIRPDTATETRLRQRIAGQTDALAPRLALAERLAREQRWAEARRSYALAHALTPADPDITYNLAVSLDHSGQRHLAADHYRMALDLAAQQPARFNPSQCAARLHALTSVEASP